MAVPTLDGHSAPVAYRLPTFDYEQEVGLNPPVHNRSAPRHVPRETHGMLAVRKTLQNQGVLPAAADIVPCLLSWEPGTERHYRPHVQRWSLFCGRRHGDPNPTTISHTVNFLTGTL